MHKKKARRIVSIDYRGRGGSDWDPDWSHYTFPVEFADILAILDKLGVASAIFIGLSRGGIHAMTLAAQRPGLVKALVLNDVGPTLDPRGLLRIKNFIGHLPAAQSRRGRRPLQARDGPAFSRLSMNIGVFMQPIRSTQRGSGCVFPMIRNWRGRWRISIRKNHCLTCGRFFTAVTAPILALRGEHSDLLTPEGHAEMAARHPMCQIHVVPGQGHAPLLLDQPTLDRIAAFIDETDEISSLPKAGEISSAER